MSDPHAIFRVLSADLDSCFKRLENAFENPGEEGEAAYDASDVRSYVRAAFACIEGMCFSVRVWGTARGAGDINLEVIEDEVSRSMAHLSVEENVNLTVTLLDRVYGVAPLLDTSQQWWGSFNEAVALRDRLNRPRGASDLDITSAELVTMVDAEAGFRLLLASYLELELPGEGR